jgi:hypothetical protein
LAGERGKRGWRAVESQRPCLQRLAALCLDTGVRRLV